MGQVVDDIPVAAIRRDPGQPRTEFSDEELAQLAESLRSEGLLQPIVVRPDGDGYVVVVGERRWRAAQMLGWEKIPAIVRNDMDEGTLRKLQLLENVVRSDLSPVEVARAYKAMMDQGMTAREIGQAVGKDPGTVTWLTQILDCRPDVLHLVHKGQITPTLAWYLSKLSPEGQSKALRSITDGMRLQEAIGVCNRIWAEENQVEAFKEQVVAKERVRVARRFQAMFDRACQAINSLWKYEERSPGSLVNALGHDLEGARERVQALKDALEELERILTVCWCVVRYPQTERSDKEGAGMGVLAVLSSLGERLALGSSLPRECWMRRCDYYTHYLAYQEPGEPSLSHDAYHAAAAKCDEAQEALDG